MLVDPLFPDLPTPAAGQPGHPRYEHRPQREGSDCARCSTTERTGSGATSNCAGSPCSFSGVVENATGDRYIPRKSAAATEHGNDAG